jgi:hypothetical protein
VKLKLLHALFCGRFCLTNPNGVKGSNISTGLFIADGAAAWISRINSLMAKEFNAEEKEERTPILVTYNNQKNAELLSGLW